MVAHDSSWRGGCRWWVSCRVAGPSAQCQRGFEITSRVRWQTAPENRTLTQVSSRFQAHFFSDSDQEAEIHNERKDQYASHRVQGSRRRGNRWNSPAPKASGWPNEVSPQGLKSPSGHHRLLVPGRRFAQAEHRHGHPDRLRYGRTHEQETRTYRCFPRFSNSLCTTLNTSSK